MRLAHARPGGALERRDGDSRHAIEIVAAIAAPSGEPAGFVDVTADAGRWKWSRCAPTRIRRFVRLDPRRSGCAALAGGGSIPSAPPTDDQMFAAAARALGTEIINGP